MMSNDQLKNYSRIDAACHHGCSLLSCVILLSVLDCLITGAMCPTSLMDRASVLVVTQTMPHVSGHQSTDTQQQKHIQTNVG